MNYLEILIAFISVILLASLLVTIITQMVISLFNLRGKNLFWGLERLLSNLQPDDNKGIIKNITEGVLKHPLISRFTKRYASVVRVEELCNINRYRQIYKIQLEKKFKYMGDQLLSLNSNLEQLGLGVLTKKYCPLTKWNLSKILGMLISIALLSLGAPFWFKVLRSLVNLRSRLMETEEKERDDRKKKTQ